MSRALGLAAPEACLLQRPALATARAPCLPSVLVCSRPRREAAQFTRDWDPATSWGSAPAANGDAANGKCWALPPLALAGWAAGAAGRDGNARLCTHSALLYAMMCTCAPACIIINENLRACMTASHPMPLVNFSHARKQGEKFCCLMNCPGLLLLSFAPTRPTTLDTWMNEWMGIFNSNTSY